MNKKFRATITLDIAFAEDTYYFDTIIEAADENLAFLKIVSEKWFLYERKWTDKNKKERITKNFIQVSHIAEINITEETEEETK
jgi:hypothetical protein